MKNIVTHSGGFHADDVFAVAAFQLLFGVENISVTRTREESLISKADYVVDVGGVYDHEKGRYDHHQLGAPVRENGIPYAGFGLMWKHYGVEICGSEEIAQAIDERLCQPIDAGDNGVSLYTLNELEVQPFELYNFISLYSPVWGSEESKDEKFFEAVEWACGVLSRIIQKEQAKGEMSQYIKDVYEAADDKSLLIFDKPVAHAALIDFQDVDVIVCPDDPQSNDNWSATCIRKGYDTFSIRVQFPQEWSGLRTEELAEVSQIEDAVFCHKAGFVFVAGSKESAIKAAKMVK